MHHKNTWLKWRGGSDGLPAVVAVVIDVVDGNDRTNCQARLAWCSVNLWCVGSSLSNMFLDKGYGVRLCASLMMGVVGVVRTGWVWQAEALVDPKHGAGWVWQAEALVDPKHGVGWVWQAEALVDRKIDFAPVLETLKHWGKMDEQTAHEHDETLDEQNLTNSNIGPIVFARHVMAS